MLKLIEEDERGENYQADGFEIVYRKQGSVTGDNDKNAKEIIYLINGSAEVTLENETAVVKAPEKIKFPANTYHKIKALTDISFILFVE